MTKNNIDWLNSLQENLSDDEVIAMTEKINKKIEELKSLTPKERLAQCEEIATKLPDIIKQAETIQVKTEAQQNTIQSQLNNIKSTIKEKYNVDNSDDLRVEYDKILKEYTELSGVASVVADELAENIEKATQNYQEALKVLNS